MGENIIQLIKFCENLELSHKLAENHDLNRNYSTLAEESFIGVASEAQRNEVK
jgi:hypothetical protein